jgi:hypothetical protein
MDRPIEDYPYECKVRGEKGWRVSSWHKDFGNPCVRQMRERLRGHRLKLIYRYRRAADEPISS